MNKYEVKGVVGEGKIYLGAYSSVIKCINKETGAIVAIKRFKDSEDDEVIRKNTIREIKLLHQLRHQNIVELKEVFRRQRRLHLVFEYVDYNLLEVLEQTKNGLSVNFNQLDRIRLYIFQLCKAIEFCHRNDVVHRDVKPENLLISSANYLKLCDFGFARTMGKSVVLTDYVATRWYRSPELLLGTGVYGKEMDIWAIGCIMGELIDGQPLFPGQSEIDQLYLIQKVLGPLMPQQLEQFQKNPRYLGLKFPQLQRPETLDRRYLGKIDIHAMDFLKRCLKLDPQERLTAQQTLDHPFINQLVANDAINAPRNDLQSVAQQNSQLNMRSRTRGLPYAQIHKNEQPNIQNYRKTQEILWRQYNNNPVQNDNNRKIQYKEDYKQRKMNVNNIYNKPNRIQLTQDFRSYNQLSRQLPNLNQYILFSQNYKIPQKKSKQIRYDNADRGGGLQYDNRPMRFRH